MGWIGRDRWGRRFRGFQYHFQPNRTWGRREHNPSTQRGGARVRYWNKKIWRGKDEIITIFVDNIDRKTTPEIIRKEFERFGDVCEIYISRKQRANTPKNFGFVKMKGPSKAYRAIRHMRGKWIDNSRIFVREARFKKKDKFSENGRDEGMFTGSGNPKLTRGKLIREIQPCTSEETMKPVEEDKFIKAKVNQSILEELERSLIGVCEEPRSVEVLSNALINQWFSISKVRDLGPYKFIVTFLDKGDMEHAIETKNPLLMQYFTQISPWDIYQQGDTRRVWIEVMGIPPQVWSRDTCERIASKFGSLVCWDSRAEIPDSFVSCRIMIDTNIMSYISEVLYISIEEQSIGKSIYVREGTNLTSCYVRQPEHHPNPILSSYQWDDTVSGQKPNNVDAQFSERDSGMDNLGALEGVEETPENVEAPVESEKSITLIGDINYDINEEEEIIGRCIFKTHLENSNILTTSEDDCPPGFQRILKTKKSKRRGTTSVLKNNITHSRKNKVTKKARNQYLRNEVAEGVNQSSGDSIEPWSEDDYEMDPERERQKSREFGKSLGFGVGKSLNIEDLLN